MSNPWSNTPWSHITSNNSNTGYTPPTPIQPIYTPTPIVVPNIPPPVTNPAVPIGHNPSGYTSANPIADFICAPSHSTPWPHNAGNNFRR